MWKISFQSQQINIFTQNDHWISPLDHSNLPNNIPFYNRMNNVRFVANEHTAFFITEALKSLSAKNQQHNPRLANLPNSNIKISKFLYMNGSPNCVSLLEAGNVVGGICSYILDS